MIAIKLFLKEWDCSLVKRNAIGRLILLFEEELLRIVAGKDLAVPQLCSPASSSG